MSVFDHDKFREIYPVSFIMRKAISDFWFRIHSLPESKRYPEDETEWEILLSNAVSVAEWNRDDSEFRTLVRPESPFGSALLLTGLFLIFFGPWLSRGTFLRRFAVFGITLVVLLIYMIPMTILFVESGVPFQD